MKRDHWKSLYDLKFWKLVMGWWVEGAAKGQVERVISEARLPRGARILDVPCGIGRHSIEFAKRGFQVDALDFSKIYIEKAKQSAIQAKVGDRVRFQRGDMRSLSKHYSAETFDAVVMLGNSFGYFDDKRDDLKVLREVRRVLKPGGVFVWDTGNGDALKFIFQEFLPKTMGLKTLDLFFQTTPGIYAGVNFAFDPKQGRASGEWSFFDVKKKKFEIKSIAYQVNIYSWKQQSALLKKAGLLAKKRWKVGLDGTPFTKKYAVLQTLNVYRVKA